MPTISVAYSAKPLMSFRHNPKIIDTIPIANFIMKFVLFSPLLNLPIKLSLIITTPNTIRNQGIKENIIPASLFVINTTPIVKITDPIIPVELKMPLFTTTELAINITPIISKSTPSITLRPFMPIDSEQHKNIPNINTIDAIISVFNCSILNLSMLSPYMF